MLPSLDELILTAIFLYENYRHNSENKIGQGGFGSVYKGKLRNGSLVAIKRAKKNMYDKELSAEFRSEIETLSKIEHSNLVRFLSYLEHEDERLIMIEYVNNGSLREHHDGRNHFLDSLTSFWSLKKYFLLVSREHLDG